MIVGLVLLIACANVADLVFARATARRGEMAMRLALGTTRPGIMRQVFTEPVPPAAAGALAGAILAWWGVRALVATVASNVPLNVQPNLAVFGFAAGVSVLAALIVARPAIAAGEPLAVFA